MLFVLRDIKKAVILGTDGDIGHIDQFLFDDEKWVVRYLVVKTRWLRGKKVLVPPSAVKKVDVDLGFIELSLTRKKIQESPDVDTDRPVSRQKETQYLDHYQLPYYSLGSDIWGMSERPTSMLGQAFPVPPREHEAAPYFSAEESDPHLRSVDVIEGYRLNADGEIFGRVKDFLIDFGHQEGAIWRITSLLIDLHRIWPGKTVLISSRQVNQISWSERTVEVNLTNDQVRNLPEYTQDRTSDWAKSA